MKLEGHKGSVEVMALSPDEKLLASASADKSCCLWDLATGKELLKWNPHEQPVSAMAFSPDGQTLVTAGADKTLKVWNIGYIRKELNAIGLGW